MNICLISVPYSCNGYRVESFTKYMWMCTYTFCTNQVLLVPPFSTFSILIPVCFYWSPDIGIYRKGWSVSRSEITS